MSEGGAQPTQKMSRGGRRPGAGRKRALHPRQLINFSVDAEVISWLRQRVPARRRSEFFEQLLRCALGGGGGS
jgi:hypothetical protein